MYIVHLWQVDFTADEHDAIQSALRKHLGPSFISQRVGAGGQKVCFKFTKLMMAVIHLKCSLQLNCSK